MSNVLAIHNKEACQHLPDAWL